MPNAVRYDHAGDGIEEAFEQSCERLSTAVIDILYVHDIGAYTHGDAENARNVADLVGSGLDRCAASRGRGASERSAWV